MKNLGKVEGDIRADLAGADDTDFANGKSSEFERHVHLQGWVLSIAQDVYVVTWPGSSRLTAIRRRGARIAFGTAADPGREVGWRRCLKVV